MLLGRASRSSASLVPWLSTCCKCRQAAGSRVQEYRVWSRTSAYLNSAEHQRLRERLYRLVEVLFEVRREDGREDARDGRVGHLGEAARKRKQTNRV